MPFRTHCFSSAFASVLALSCLALPAFGQAAPAAQLPQAAHQASSEPAYSVETTLVATLLDDPAAAAILARLIPTIYANELFQTMGRSQTLRAVQQYEPVALSDAKLAEIQAEFDKLAR